MTSYCVIFRIGSLPPILGKTSTPRANHSTGRLGHGSLRAAHCQNGKIRDQARSYGLAGNVSYCPLAVLRFLQRLIPSLVHSGRWEDRPLVGQIFHLLSLELTGLVSSAVIEDIDTMQKSGLASLAIFYYDFREDGKKHLSGLLSSVLFQLCDQSDSYHSILSAFYSTHRNGAQSPGDDKLVQCLMDLLKCPGRLPVYLVIDALDECPSTSSLSSPREKLLSFLEDLVEAQLPNLCICVTSRPELDIKGILGPLAFRSVSLHEESGQKYDIMKYIVSIVNTNQNMQNWSPEHKQLVIDVLTSKADGM